MRNLRIFMYYIGVKIKYILVKILNANLKQSNHTYQTCCKHIPSQFENDILSSLSFM